MDVDETTYPDPIIAAHPENTGVDTTQTPEDPRDKETKGITVVPSNTHMLLTQSHPEDPERQCGNSKL